MAADADLDAAATAVAWGGLFNGGQACVGVERVYVEAGIRDEFLSRLRERVAKVSVGVEPLSAYGPMTVGSQVDIVRRHVTDALAAGAEPVFGGLESIRPPFVDPIVLADVPEDCSAVREETFGPVIVVNTVADVDEAVSRANGTPFGLGSSVFSARRGPEIARRLRAGGTTVNAVLSFVGMPSVPFGGVGESGFGRSHGDDGLREMAFPKATVRKRFGTGQDMQSFPRTPEQFDQVRKVIRMRYGRVFRERDYGPRHRPHQGRQRGAERRVEAHGGAGVAARLPLVDDHDADAAVARPQHEAVAGHHGQGRAQHQQRAAPLDEVEAVLHAVPGHGLAEEHDVGLQRALAAGRAADHDELVQRLVGQVGVPVGVHLGRAGREPRVGGAQPLSSRSGARWPPQVAADHAVEAAVELDDVAARRPPGGGRRRSA